MRKIEFNYKDISLVSQDKLDKNLDDLNNYIEYLQEVDEHGGYDAWESSINLPSDENMVDRVKGLADKKRGEELKYIVVAGIGGSNLGTLAIYKSLYGKFDLAKKERLPKILFVDTTSSKKIKDVKGILENEIDKPEEILFCIVSKSGTTTETISNFETLYNQLSNDLDRAEDRVVAITGNGSDLWKKAEEKDIDTLEIPEKVGGRFSVFSPVGLFPLYLAGINIEEVLKGAEEMKDRCISKGSEDNIAAISASSIYHHNKEKNKNIHNTFIFNPYLEDIGKWYRQLTGESLGKKFNKDGEEVNAGITPVVSIGTTDLHSVGQLYFGGPNDKFTTFVYSPEEENIDIPSEPVFESLVNGIYGKDLSEVMDAIYKGVKRSYKDDNLPFVEVRLDEITPYTIGAFLEFKMIEIMYLAELLEVNAFNQPNVEGYKEKTREILEE